MMKQPLDHHSESSEPADSPEQTAAPAATGLPKWRLSLLGFNVLLMIAGFVWVSVDAKVGQLQPYEFPETVELPDATLSGSERIKPVKKPEYEGSSYAAGRHYTYRYQGQPLDIEIRYVLDTVGGVDKFTREHPQIEAIEATEGLSGQVRFLDDVGNYAFLTYADTAYISACINPRGKTTATVAQYQRNQELYDTVLGRLGVWLLGRERWRDDRCLWTFMYTDITDDPEDAIATLEAAWQDWAHHWQDNFPPL
jgi:cyanosortase A-associated protein